MEKVFAPLKVTSPSGEENTRLPWSALMELFEFCAEASPNVAAAIKIRIILIETAFERKGLSSGKRHVLLY